MLYAEMLSRNKPREFVQIQYKLKIRFICNFSWAHLLEVGCVLCFLWESSVLLDILHCDANAILLYLFFSFASQGYATVYYINSPQQSICRTGELATDGWVGGLLLGLSKGKA